MKIALLSFVALQATAVHGLVIAAHKDWQEPAANASAQTAATTPTPAATTTVTPKFETVRHMKEPGDGYTKGSPLYEKQQERQANASSTDAENAVEAYAGEVAAIYGHPYDHLEQSVGCAAFYVLIVLAFAYLYKSKMVEQVSPSSQEAPNDNEALKYCRCGFMFSACECQACLGADRKLCMWSFCCPIVQWAGTAQRSVQPFLSFWTALALMLCLVVLSPFTYGLTSLILGVVVLIRRRKLREVYKHDHPNAMSWFQDICCVFFCNSFFCCQLVQEAREVEYGTVQKKASISAPAAEAFRGMSVPSSAPQMVMAPVVFNKTASMPQA